MNPQRQVEMTGLQQNLDSYDGMGIESGAPLSDTSAMSRIAPEQLAGLLNASSSSTLNAATLDGIYCYSWSVQRTSSELR